MVMIMCSYRPACLSGCLRSAWASTTAVIFRDRKCVSVCVVLCVCVCVCVCVWGQHGGLTARRPWVRIPVVPGPFCVEFACSPRACVGLLRVLRFPPPSQRHALHRMNMNECCVCS